MNTTQGVLVGIAMFCGTVAAAANKPSKAELAAITSRGAFLAEYDAAAWHATDIVKAGHPVEWQVRRYIARKTEMGWVVDFGRLNGAADKFLVAYEAVQTGPDQPFSVKTLDPVREDAGWNLGAARGIETAMIDHGGFSRPYNVAVVPAQPEGMYVYLYPAQVEASVYPVGGDVRYHISRVGTTIIAKRQMHKTVIESAAPKAGAKTSVGFHSHVLSDLPEDTDVLLVLTRRPRVPEIIVAGECIFTVDVSGGITVEEDSDRRRGR